MPGTYVSCYTKENEKAGCGARCLHSVESVRYNTTAIYDGFVAYGSDGSKSR
jgi:hypothetical protein